VKQENVEVLRTFVTDVHGAVVHISNALTVLTELRTKAFPQRVSWRGLLEIGEDLKV